MHPSLGMNPTKTPNAPAELPLRPGRDPHEIENPGDPGPPVLVPETTGDPRESTKLPPQTKPETPGV